MQPWLTHPALKDVCVSFPCSSVANASACSCSYFRVFSVKFRVNPWLILILLLPSVSFPCKSVANSSASAYSSFREIPC